MKTSEQTDIPELVRELGRNAKAAGRVLAQASTDAKNTALHVAAAALRTDAETIKDANAIDMAAA